MLKEEGETYIVGAGLSDELAEEVTPVTLYTTIDRQGSLALCPVRLPRQDGRHDSWTESLRRAVEIAEHSWVRAMPNMSNGGYDVVTATSALSDPEWPDKPFEDLLRVAFRDRIIESIDHPVVRKLRGLV